MTQETETVLSLAVERKKFERSFQDERKQMVSELTDLWLSPTRADVIASDVLFADWLVFRAQDILKTYSLDYNDAGAVIELAKFIRSDWLRNHT